MTIFDRLVKHFERFPGIGSRQAKRFAFHILTQPEEDMKELSELIRSLRQSVVECPSCFRFHAPYQPQHTLCSVCQSTTRDHTKLTVVERDSDIDAIERSGMYDGLYFVLGGMVPLLHAHDTTKLRGGALKHMVSERAQAGLSEIILAFSVNPDGENTARYIEMLLKDILTQYAVQISYLGRGLSTGSELEYADPETIKNAFKNRG